MALMRNNFVRRAISRMDRCSRNAQRRKMLKNAMSIAPLQRVNQFVGLRQPPWPVLRPLGLA